GRMAARFRCLGGVDSNPAAIQDFERLTGVPGTVLDLFSREQYQAFHGQEPPAHWREVTPADIRNAAAGERPHIVFTSAPCKGFSGLLPQKSARTARYQALNGLTLRGVWLALEAWADDPPEFILFENVPRIQSRGRQLLDDITALLRAYGYAVAETTHDCGELGGLAQRRRRFLLVARHETKVPPFLYEPESRPLQAIGDVLGRMPLPGDSAAGAMHRVPRLQWRTWVRLALVEAGQDWRSLERLRVKNGLLQDYLIVPEHYGYRDVLGVRAWEEASGTVAGRSRPTNGFYSIADPRWQGHEYGQYGVRRWNDASGAVSGQSAPGGGRYSVADPRTGWHHAASRNKYRVVRWDELAGTVVGATRPAAGALSVADPRTGLASDRAHYRTGGQYGVVPWSTQTGAVTGAARHDSGRWSVADPRLIDGDTADLPDPKDRLVAVIEAEDGTWHRPFTTLELAALQGLVDPEAHLELEGLSDSAWRERIGNAVPPPAAQAIASVMGQTLLLAWSGETFVLNNQPIWVRPLALAGAVDTHRTGGGEEGAVS
ncbi:MAG TPA: DNA cytosine methyltransferase, partial [Gammaproteobacteria bacterium]|nr:DNA cytosine methyltransferase [Gammaproteobacteria bacterium]